MRNLLAALSLAVALFAGLFASADAASAAGSPAQDYAACVAVYHYHHVAVTYGGDDITWANRVWLHAWHLAGYADNLAGDSMRYHIRHYLMTNEGWSLVAYDCNPDG